MDKPNVQILSDADELAEAAAQAIVSLARNAVSARGAFTIALSGGSTPKRLYELLANPGREYRDQFPWSQTLFFWTDERHVPPDNSESNFRMTDEAMLSHVPVPGGNVHRFLAELPDAQEVASEYETQLRNSFQNSLPAFDLILLGLGPDGHTASLFPGTTALTETERWVTAPWVEKFNSYRLTMTLPVLNNAAVVMFLVSGKDKATILNEVLSEGEAKFPAQLIKPTHGELRWLVDKAAISGPQASPPAG
ncbi:MAG TPA: 6-phosphogluconolactonase [Pyrinomonadaceae bacterium]